MALARVQYQQTVSGTTNFTVSFPYISKDHVKASVDGTDVTFTWINSNTIKLDTAPAVGAIIDIRRETERVNLLVDFQDASTITEKQLDLAAQQTFYIAQEAFDATGGTMAVANDGSYSANGRRISNLATPDSDDDAASVGWVKAQYNSGYDAHAEAQNAAQSASAAASSETAANNSKNAAAASASSAAASASSAATSESNTKASATAAADSASSAAGSASSAAASASQAAGYAAAVNMPSLSGEGGNLLRVKADASGYDFLTPYTAYGIGVVGAWATVDANGYTTPGTFVSCYGNSTNIPVQTAGYLVVLGAGDGSSQVGQEYTVYTTGETYKRVRLNGTWQPWVKFATFNGILGGTNVWTGPNTFSNGVIVYNGNGDTPDIVFDDGTYQVHEDISSSVYRTYLVRKSDNAVLGFPFQFNLPAQTAQIWGGDVPRIQTETKAAAGNYLDFSLPAWAKRISVSFEAVKQTGAAHYLVQINGVTSGYFSRATQYNDYNIAPTNGFGWPNNSANNVMTGIMEITRGSANYTSNLNSTLESGSYWQFGQGRLPLAAAPSSLRVQVGGAATFSAGYITVIAEG